ncbi:FMN-binding negative transcriptional regulator [Pedobacter aquae]|uniref:FMN-binding negative transcriptional regulator n=1 Tax=Pedobacter aquae TaxID=2605747 RepID=A0A5C0VHM3_9SPHI|nr:FMN-binding negative transcriptional regulator [Pedobacter aquae]QEK50730.1 FMN-binding negative transcriptional regulator [Pedobacter aquae]
MYVSKINLMDDQAESIQFMQKFSFGSIITTINNEPVATHLPFITELRNGKIMITSHFAKVNQQWQSIENNKNLIIFSEPHAYISPKNYEKELNVPTWNYISVHAYGFGKILTDESLAYQVLEKTINFYEADYKKQWDNLPKEYKNKLINGIVAFEIEVLDLQGKKKLSQNRSDIEKQNIINTLSDSHQTHEKLIAEYMNNQP